MTRRRRLKPDAVRADIEMRGIDEVQRVRALAMIWRASSILPSQICGLSAREIGKPFHALAAVVNLPVPDAPIRILGLQLKDRDLAFFAATRR